MAKDARSIILGLIQKSSDNTLPQGKHFRSKGYLGRIFFSDFMDVVVYYISLQNDLDEITRIKMDDLKNLLKNLWDELDRKVANNFYDLFGHPWISGDSGPSFSGPYFTGAGLDYFNSTPGIGLYSEFLLEYFRYPQELRGQSRHNRWPDYKKDIENEVFPKYRRIKHKEILHKALDFAENVCRKLRERRNTIISPQ